MVLVSINYKSHTRNQHLLRLRLVQKTTIRLSQHVCGVLRFIRICPSIRWTFSNSRAASWGNKYGWLPGLVNIQKTQGKSPLYSKIHQNPPFRLGHGHKFANCYIVITRGYRFSEVYGLWDIYIYIIYGLWDIYIYI